MHARSYRVLVRDAAAAVVRARRQPSQPESPPPWPPPTVRARAVRSAWEQPNCRKLPEPSGQSISRRRRMRRAAPVAVRRHAPLRARRPGSARRRGHLEGAVPRGVWVHAVAGSGRHGVAPPAAHAVALRAAGSHQGRCLGGLPGAGAAWLASECYGVLQLWAVAPPHNSPTDARPCPRTANLRKVIVLVAAASVSAAPGSCACLRFGTCQFAPLSLTVSA